MSRLTRDGTPEPVSRDKILRCERGQGNINLPVQLTTSRIGNFTRSIHTLAICVTLHTYIHTKITYLCDTLQAMAPTEISKRFTKSPYSISRATSIDSDGIFDGIHGALASRNKH